MELATIDGLTRQAGEAEKAPAQKQVTKVWGQRFPGVLVGWWE